MCKDFLRLRFKSLNPKLLLMIVDWNTNKSTNGISGPPSIPWVNGTMEQKSYPKNWGYHFSTKKFIVACLECAIN